MAWFGDTFGDGLSSIKGQITKFTNDVLSEDPLAASSFEGKIKQLEEKNAALQNEIDNLRSETQTPNSSKGCELSDYQIQSICELESKIFDLTNEKDALTKALEEIETEHQKELQIVIKDRDQLKAQNCFNQITNHSQSENEIFDLRDQIKSLQLQNDILFEEGKSKDAELKKGFLKTDSLNSEVATLRLQIAQLNDKTSKINRKKYSIKENKEEIKHLENERNKMLVNISDLSDKMKALEENYELEKSKTNKLLKALQESNTTIVGNTNLHLDDESGPINTCSLDDSDLNSQISDFRKALQEKLKKFERLRIENGELQEKVCFVNSDLNDLRDQLSLLEKENMELNMKIKDTENLKEENHKLLLRLQGTDTDNTTIVEQLKEEMENMLLKNTNLEEAIKNHNIQFNEKCQDIEDLKEENHKLLARLQGTVDENATIVEMLTKEKLHLQNQIQNLPSEDSHTTLKDLNEKLKIEITGLKRECSSANEKYVSLMDAQNLIEESKLNVEEKLEKLASENDSLKLKLKEVQVQARVVEDLKKEISELKDHNEELRNRIGDITGTEAEIEKDKETKETENQLGALKSNFEKQLEDFQMENASLKIEIANHSEIAKENEHLKSKLEKLEILVARTEERENLVSGTLELEIGKLKSLVGRIRKEFLRDPTEQAVFWEEEPTENVMIQSQTDDVKRIQQDVLQMTEVIKMIDQGLTSIYEDKRKLEKELSIVQSLAVKTEKELMVANKAKQQLETNIQEWAAAVANRDDMIQHLSLTQTTLQNEKDELTAKLTSVTLEMQRKNSENAGLSEKMREMEAFSLEWNKRIVELQNLYQSESKRCDKLLKRKDEEISGLKKMMSSAGNADEVPSTNSQPELDDVQHQMARLLDENSDLKVLIQQLRENIINMNTKLPEIGDDAQQREAPAKPKNEHKDYQTLLAKHSNLIEKESSLRREVERLRAHMVEVEENYTEEVVVAKTELAELRAKLSTVEDQLQKATSVHKSANVRSTQHVEALQVQVQLTAEQRNDLQKQLSDAEDEAQKQAAALASLQLVLEQFQLDKQREMKYLEEKLEYQIDLERRRCKELQVEVDTLTQQLSEAKNGLKAALRLGEQLEKKSVIITDLEDELNKIKQSLQVAEDNLRTINKSTSAKIDKFLVKNLVIGYLTAQGDHKNEALKILTSVLELSGAERAKVGVENQGGWLSHLLHPSPNSAPSEPLSQAFVRFLESESKPQPHLKLLTDTPKNHGGVKRTPLALSDLVLPPVTPTQVTDTTLSDMLKDS